MALRAAPLILVLVLQTVLTRRLDNVAFSDEALYIDAGHAYLRQWNGGPPASESFGGFFSGFPYAYPVLAALLDTLGGLELVRAASLLLMMGVTVCVYGMGRWLGGARHGRTAGAMSALVAALSGSTAVVGNLAIFDAACVFLVSAASYLALTRSSTGSAALAGFLVGAAGIVKYTGAAFIPVVVAIALVATPTVVRGVRRGLVALVSSVVTILAVYVPNRDWIQAGIAFTTADREAHNYRSLLFLLGELAQGAGILLVMAVVGVAVWWDRARSVRAVLLGLGLMASGLALTAGQMSIHEYTSFNKHLVFAVVFLAPLAGQVVALRARTVRVALVAGAAYLLLVSGLYRADFMFTEWPDSTRVVDLVKEEGSPGTYIGVGAFSMAYYSKDRPDLVWEEPWTLFGSGDEAIRAAVASDRYQGIIYTSGETGSEALDQDVALLASLVQADPDYVLAGSWPKHPYDENEWFVWLRVDG